MEIVPRRPERVTTGMTLLEGAVQYTIWSLTKSGVTASVLARISVGRSNVAYGSTDEST